MQQEQSSSDGEGRDCSSPRTHRGAPAALWALYDSRAMSAANIGQPRRPVACSGRAQRWGRGYGRLERYGEA